MRFFTVLLLSLTLLGVTPPAVVVDYAGSLVTPMEGPIAAALRRDRGLTFEGEGKGSKALANLIRDWIRSPDVFISADESLVRMLATHGLVARAVTFGGAELGIGFTAGSRFGRQLDAAQHDPGRLLRVLESPGIRLARTDPRLDPKGERTVRAVQMFAGTATRSVLGDAQNPGQIFPEEDLLVRLESGNADAAFVYSTEARARNLAFIPLPGKASLRDEITYTLAIMRNAPHPAEARVFAAYIIAGPGKTILQRAGVRYFANLKRL